MQGLDDKTETFSREQKLESQSLKAEFDIGRFPGRDGLEWIGGLMIMITLRMSVVDVRRGEHRILFKSNSTSAPRGPAVCCCRCLSETDD